LFLFYLVNVPPTPPAETKVPKVELTKTADKANAKVGEEITYTITAKNSGNGYWENGTITDKIPTEYVNLISGTTVVNGEKVEDNEVWKDNVLNVKQTIKAGESVTITFKVKTIKGAEGGKRLRMWQRQMIQTYHQLHQQKQKYL
ncbi:TPA: isopeptide-forming domain-containing fimbrial protein, partial [Enterococcus faecalis]